MVKGIYFKRPGSLPALGLGLAASVALWLTARADEQECQRVFGDEYREYMKETRRFIAYVV